MCCQAVVANEEEVGFLQLLEICDRSCCSERFSSVAFGVKLVVTLEALEVFVRMSWCITCAACSILFEQVRDHDEILWVSPLIYQVAHRVSAVFTVFTVSL